jgi:hypothetical protein
MTSRTCYRSSTPIRGKRGRTPCRALKAGEIVLSGEVLGDIYLGKIKKWNGPAIALGNDAGPFASY